MSYYQEAFAGTKPLSGEHAVTRTEPSPGPSRRQDQGVARTEPSLGPSLCRDHERAFVGTNSLPDQAFAWTESLLGPTARRDQPSSVTNTLLGPSFCQDRAVAGTEPWLGQIPRRDQASHQTRWKRQHDERNFATKLINAKLWQMRNHKNSANVIFWRLTFTTFVRSVKS